MQGIMEQIISFCFVLFCVFNGRTTVSSYTIFKNPKGVIPEFESAVSKFESVVPTEQDIRNSGERREKDVNNKCQPLTIPMCRRIGYNTTSVQNNIYSNGAKGADIETYLSYFENEICFEDLLFFVCTLFNPICFKNHDKPVLPCKSECMAVKRECKSTIERFHAHWPLQLNCNHLPDYQTSVCIKKDSIVTKAGKSAFRCLCLDTFSKFLNSHSSFNKR